MPMHFCHNAWVLDLLSESSRYLVLLSNGCVQDYFSSPLSHKLIHSLSTYPSQRAAGPARVPPTAAREGCTASCLYRPSRILGGLARCSGSQGCMPSTCSACFGKQCHGYTVAGLGLSSGSIPARRVTEIRWVYLLWPELGFVVSTTLALGPVPPY